MYINAYGERFTVCRHNRTDLHRCLPNESHIDCFVVNLDRSLTLTEIDVLANILADRRFQWIEVFGYMSEKIHDAIDRMAVANGRQQQVGDGSPMTTWDTADPTEEALAAYFTTGGQGDAVCKVILVIGTDEDASILSSALASLTVDDASKS